METVFFQLAEQLTPEEIVQVCSTNTQLQKFCENEDLWQSLYLRRFGSLSYSPVSWKYEYTIRNTPQKVFKYRGTPKLFSVILPPGLNAIKKIAFSPEIHLGWLLTWEGRVYGLSQKNYDIRNEVVDYAFRLESDLFTFPVDQLVTTNGSVLVVDKNGQAYISRDIYGNARMEPLTLPPFNDVNQRVRKIWVIFDSAGQGDYYLLSENDQMYHYSRQRFTHIPQLSNRQIIELGGSGGFTYAITPTQSFVYVKNDQHESNLINSPEPIIMAENQVMLTVNHQTYWIANHPSSAKPTPWLDVPVQKISGNFALSTSGELYHRNPYYMKETNFHLPVSLAKLGDYRIVDIFGVGAGVGYLMILAALPVPISSTIYQKLVDHNQIDLTWTNQNGLVKDIRGNWLKISN